jgi:hypothetical protein
MMAIQGAIVSIDAIVNLTSAPCSLPWIAGRKTDQMLASH